MRTSTKDPNQMSAEERIAEIATILARVLSRSKNNKQKQGFERKQRQNAEVSRDEQSERARRAHGKKPCGISTGLKSASKHSCITQKSS